jgi:NAD(P)H-dependent FMN reductase
MKLLALSGSLRKGSSNTALIEAATAVTPDGVEIVLFDGLASLPHFNPDLDQEDLTVHPQIARLRTLVSMCGGIIISSPEYAHGMPGCLKNALDWLVSYQDFAGKPVVLWNASAAGGQYAQQALIETLTVMSARVLVKASMIEPFLKKKLAPGVALDREEARRVAASLALLASAAG